MDWDRGQEFGNEIIGDLGKSSLCGMVGTEARKEGVGVRMRDEERETAHRDGLFKERN